MYKKVTVVKEYFKEVPDDALVDYTDGINGATEWYPDNGSYDAMQMKKAMKYKKGMKAGKNLKAANVFSTVDPENTEVGVAIRMGSRDFFTRYNNLLRDYIVSKSSKHEDAETIKGLLELHARTIGTVVTTWYRPENVTAFANSFVSLHSAAIPALDARIAGTDSAGAMDQFMATAGQFSTALSSLNAFPAANTWPAEGVKDIMVSFVNSVIRQIDARKTKDWDTDQSAAKVTYNILVSGLPTGMAGFADVLSKGVIVENPWRFNL